jgi:pSer/pThr/pTyr-binding forkhead associated (FHA) protein
MATGVVLAATEGGLKGQEFAFSPEWQVVLGRSPDCTLRLAGDIGVSRQHCLIEVDEAGAWVKDLGSLNGTFVNGQSIGQRDRDRQADAAAARPPRRLLQEGDELRIGAHAFRVEMAGWAHPGSGRAGAGISAAASREHQQRYQPED